jgi:hypothetical protein
MAAGLIAAVGILTTRRSSSRRPRWSDRSTTPSWGLQLGITEGSPRPVKRGLVALGVGFGVAGGGRGRPAGVAALVLQRRFWHGREFRHRLVTAGLAGAVGPAGRVDGDDGPPAEGPEGPEGTGRP